MVNSTALAWVVIISVALIVLAGVIAVLWHRISLIRNAPDHAVDLRMTRPVIAILLIGGLVLLTVWALGFGNPDGQLQLLLAGAVVSLSSAAVAFYFSSSGAADARRDLLAATTGKVIVPVLHGQRVLDAQKLLSGKNLVLVVNPPGAPDTDLITDQQPRAGQFVVATADIHVTAEPMATDATAGAPGAFTPANQVVPPAFADLRFVAAPVKASPGTTWPSGNYVVLGDRSHAYWDGSAWQQGDSP